MNDSRDSWYSQYRQLIGEAVAWCAPRATVRSPRDCLRSYELRPAAFPVDRDVFARRQFISMLADKRAHALFEAGRRRWFGGDWRTPYVLPEGLEGGRLLYYEPHHSLQEGATDAASDGYFGDEDEPPWDTWIAWIAEHRAADRDARHPEYMLCWVPPVLLELVERGLDASSNGCVGWLDALDDGLTRYLRRQGYLPPLAG